MTLIEFMDKRYKNRKDKGNIFYFTDGNIENYSIKEESEG